jgi:mRNA interferase HicA
MTRLRPVPARKLIRFLEKHGFQTLSQSGSHLKMKDDMGRIVIVPVHPGKPIKVGLLRAILRGAGLDPRDLIK